MIDQFRSRQFLLFLLTGGAAAAVNFAQPGVPSATLITIIKAEDHRDAAPLVPLLASPSAQIRERAALALGRIGREDSVPALIKAVEQDVSPQVREMAVFALGEIESDTAANALIAIRANVLLLSLH